MRRIAHLIGISILALSLGTVWAGDDDDDDDRNERRKKDRNPCSDFVSDGNTIYACVNQSGKLRSVECPAACKRNESPMEWSVVGPAGPEGDTGPAGVDGADGAPGADGAIGADGATGPAGANGADGATGPAGVDGADGATGPAGADGADGATGPAGADGVDGVAGPAGADGADGATGPAGADGADGATGPAGVAGAQGEQGLQGVAGPAGADGATGTTGSVGPQGIQGETGTTGSAGSSGGILQSEFFQAGGSINATSGMQTYLNYVFTPQSSSSKLRVISTVQVLQQDNSRVDVILTRDSATLNGTGVGSSSGTNKIQAVLMSQQNSPGLSPVTYRVQFRQEAGSTGPPAIILSADLLVEEILIP